MLLKYLKIIYQAFVDAFIDIYYSFKYYFFNIWFYFYSNIFIILNRFKIFFMFFIFIYFTIDITPNDIYNIVFGLVLKIFFNFLYYFAIESTFNNPIKEMIIYFFSMDIYQK